MRIEAYSQIQQMYGTQNTKKVEESKRAESFKDQFELSTTGKDMQVAKSAVAESPDIRAELVDSIKEQIDNGTYEVNMDDFASKLINQYNGLF